MDVAYSIAILLRLVIINAIDPLGDI